MGTTRKPTGPTTKPGAKRAKRPAYLQKGDPTLERLLGGFFAEPQVWLDTPNPNFGGRKPGDLVGTDEERKVYNLLRAVDLGMF